MRFEKEIEDGEEFIYIDDAQDNLWKKNFAGRAEKYNDPGDRNFKITLDPESPEADLFRDEGVRISCWIPKDKNGNPDPEREPVYSTKINVVFGSPRHPLHIYLHANAQDFEGQELTEDQAAKWLDGMNFSQVDLKVREYHYNGGTSLYLATADFTQKLDRNDIKYHRGLAGIMEENGGAVLGGDDEEEEVPFN